MKTSELLAIITRLFLLILLSLAHAGKGKRTCHLQIILSEQVTSLLTVFLGTESIDFALSFCSTQETAAEICRKKNKTEILFRVIV